jgi:hypothetical protein
VPDGGEIEARYVDLLERQGIIRSPASTAAASRM